jgi:hypothetical protein
MFWSVPGGNIFTLCSSKLWHHAVWQVVSERSETLISRYCITEHECVANIYLPCKCVFYSSNKREDRHYYQQSTPKRWKQCWLLSPTGILGCLLMMQFRGWLEFFHSRTCQSQKQPQILCVHFRLLWLNSFSVLDDIAIYEHQID